MKAQRRRGCRVPAGVRALRVIRVTAVVALTASGLAAAQAGDGRVPDGNDSKSQVDISSIRATFDRSIVMQEAGEP